MIFIIFFALFLVLGGVFGLVFGDIIFGLIISIVIASIYFLIAWHSAESMVLGSAHAKLVTKQSHPVLYNVTEGMSVAAGIPMPKIYVIEDSALNAFATGRDPSRGVICVTTGLLAKLDRRELEGVVAHEMSHIKNYDIRVMLFAAVLVGATTLLADFILRSFLYGGKSGDRDDGKVALILIAIGLILAILSPLIAQLVQLAVSRRREYLADADAAVLTRYPKGLANALRKIKADPDPLVDHANKATAHLFISMPFRKSKSSGKFSLWNRLWSTHPPIDQRIKILESM